MGIFQLVALSLFAIGIGIIIFEGLAINNKNNYHPCPPDLWCDYPAYYSEFYLGLFPAIAGAAIIAIYKVKFSGKIVKSAKV